MRVGLITYHFAENYGSVFQAYGLVSYLNSQDGIEAEVIDYVSLRQDSNNSLYGHRRGLANIALNLAFLPFHFWRSKKHSRFHYFVENYIPCSRRITTLDELKELANGIVNTSEKYDYLIVGSDQVWNPRINDFDKAFFLPFETEAKKIGYAISLGTAHEKDIVGYRAEMQDFDIVSCREKAAVAVMNGVGLDIQRVVCDPVFLLKSSEWESLVQSAESDFGQCRPYVMCYFLHKPNMTLYFNWASKIAKRLGCELKIVNAAYSKQTFRTGTLLDVGPLEFLNLLKNATFVCTDSFHGTALSVIFEKEFLSFDREEGCVDTRKSDLLSEVGLVSRLVRVGSYDGSIPEPLTQEELASVKRNIRRYTDSSKSFIDECMVCRYLGKGDEK